MNNISALRRARGWTQTELAERAGTSQATVARLERGSDSVTLRILGDIAAALDVSLRDLFDDERSAMEMILLDYFRQLPEARQRGWIDIASQEIGVAVSKNDQKDD